MLKTLLLLLIPVPAHAGDRPTRGDARAVQAEREAFPQDTLTALRAGDAWLAVGAWSRAEQAYQVAFELSDGGAPARQGLALVRAARAPRGTITGGLTGSVYQGDVDWVGGLAGTARLDAELGGRGLVALTANTGGVTGASGTTPWVEGHGSVGAGWYEGGFRVHGGAVSGANLLATPAPAEGFPPPPDGPGPGGPGDGAGSGNGAGSGSGNGYGFGTGFGQGEAPSGDAADGAPLVASGYTVGASAWINHPGILYAEGSHTRWVDGVVTRTLLSWTSPALGPLRFEPGGSVSGGDAGLGWTGFGTLHADFDPVRLRAGGRFGDTARPTSLAQPSFWAVPGRIRWGSWAGGTVTSGAWRVALDWEWVHLERTALGGPADAHLVVTRFSRTLEGGP